MRIVNISWMKNFVIFILLLFGNFSLHCESVVYFSPKEGICQQLIKCINSSRQRIYAAIYLLTDKTIAQALIDAKNKRGIDVQIVTDVSSLENRHNKIDWLKENGIEIFIFRPNKKSSGNFGQIMHNKFALFDNKVWTGSFNWTFSADKRNRENIICVDDDHICKRYEREFERLKRRCIKSRRIAGKGRDAGNSLKEKVFQLLKSIRDNFKLG